MKLVLRNDEQVLSDGTMISNGHALDITGQLFKLPSKATKWKGKIFTKYPNSRPIDQSTLSDIQKALGYIHKTSLKPAAETGETKTIGEAIYHEWLCGNNSILIDSRYNRLITGRTDVLGKDSKHALYVPGYVAVMPVINL